MKIGVSSYSFAGYIDELEENTGKKCDYFHLCDKAKELGFEGIEFVGLALKGLVEEGKELATAKEIRAYCEKIELPVIAYTVGANLLADDIKAEMDRVKKQIDVAAALGAPLFRHDVFYALKKEPLYNYRKAIEEVTPLVRELTQYAKERGVRTCTENHGLIMQDATRVEELILAVNHENYGWLCDIGNFLCVDENPAQSVGITAPYTIHVHVKDFLFKSGDFAMPSGFMKTRGGNYLRGTVLGHGIVPVGSCINALRRAGYDGWISLEFEGKERTLDALKCGRENLQTILLQNK